MASLMDLEDLHREVGQRESERVRETMEHGSERKEVGDEAGRRRACEIFIVVSSELCCPEEAFNWDSYDVVNYK